MVLEPNSVGDDGTPHPLPPPPFSPPMPSTTGQWIAASTIVPDVPFVYGKGEAGPTESPDPSSLPSNGEGPTCTLAQLSAAIYGHECGGDYDSSAPVRPLRARISGRNDTTKTGEMPTTVAIAGFATEGGDPAREDGAFTARVKWGVEERNHLRWDLDTVNVDLGRDNIVKTVAVGNEGGRAGKGEGGMGRGGGGETYSSFSWIRTC